MRHRAFTLIELLVVIAILALLMAFLFPAFSRSRAQAKTMACKNNVRELLLSLSSYEAEHQSLPYGFDFKGGAQPPGGFIGNLAVERPGWWWFHFAGVIHYKSSKGSQVLRCPSSRLGDPALDRDLLCGKYGVNRFLCKTAPDRAPYKEELAGAPLSTSRLSHPGQTLLIVDSGYSLIAWLHATADPPVPLGSVPIEDTAYVPGLAINKSRDLRPGQSVDAKDGRHPNRTVNVGFADGHADTRPAADLLVEKTKDGGYTNMVLWQGR